MNLPYDLKFTAEDFKGEIAKFETYEFLANKANALLAKRIGKWKKVFTCEWAKSEGQWTDRPHSNDTHTAILIGVKKV